MNTMKKNYKLIKKGVNIYSLELIFILVSVFLAVEIDEKGHADRDIIFEEKRQKALVKKLGCKFVRINTSNAKNGYDLDYEVGNVQAFIDEFKNKKNKKIRKTINKRKRNEREIRKGNERNEK